MSGEKPRRYQRLDFLYGTRRDDQGDKDFLIDAGEALNACVNSIDGVNEFRIRRQVPGEGHGVILEPVGGEVTNISFTTFNHGSSTGSSPLELNSFYAGTNSHESDELPRSPSITCEYHGDLGNFVYDMNLKPV
jgi:hypothetical protein